MGIRNFESTFDSIREPATALIRNGPVLGGKRKRSEQIKTYRLHYAIQPDLKDDTDKRPNMTSTETENKCMRIKVSEVCELPKVKERVKVSQSVTLSRSDGA